MSRAEFVTQITSTQSMLQTVDDLFNNKYSTQVSNGGSLKSQSTDLDDTVIALKAKLAKVKSISDTYDREYLDRMTTKKVSFWQSRGISTLQDWILLIFFVLYTIISISLIGMVFMLNKYSVFSILLMVGALGMLGTLFVGVIVRFA